VQCSAK
jgi:hypothetical protein